MEHTVASHHAGPAPSAVAPFKVWLAGLGLRLLPLWSDIRTLGAWLESEGRLLATSGNETTFRVEAGANGRLRVEGARDASEVGDLRHLCRFLRHLRIGTLELDSRLESNQIVDVLSVLYTYRGQITRRSTGGPATTLFTEEGLLHACAVSQLHDHTLTITYSYCMTRFSRLVSWFEKRQKHFHDHRALFRAAPRYGLLLSFVVLSIVGAYAVHDNRWLLVITGLGGALVIFAATYLFIMAVGSVEYDNEEKARKLARAYDQLKLYADRIRGDLDRARAVQQKMLPTLAEMPFGSRVEWGTSYLPEEEVGGDYFDAAALDDRRVAWVFSDVCGHGLSAALVTAIIKTSFQAWVEGARPIEEFVDRLNKRLRQLTPGRSFAAVVVGVLDTVSGEMSYVNCGHSPQPIMLSADGQSPTAMEAGGCPILGVFGDVRPSSASVSVVCGDSIVLATDGLTETLDATGEPYGIDRLYDLLARRRKSSIESLVREMVADVQRFSRGAATHHDDRTVMAFRLR